MRTGCLFVSLLGSLLFQISLAADPPAASDTTPGANTPTVTDKGPAGTDFEQYAKGYRVRKKDGQKLYCRNEAPLGSRLQQTVCLTEEQLREQFIAAEEVRNNMRKRSCVNGQ